MEQSVEIFRLRAIEKGLDLVCEISPNLPATIVGDRHRLRQVVVNLVGNAVKFTDSGSVKIVAEAESASEREITARFTVSDTGVGIPEDRLAIIFEPFRQADASTHEKYGGTGLGLSICSRLVELMGGGIEVESRPGEGSRFRFSVRLAICPPGAENGPDVTGDGCSIPALRILLAEDNAVNQKLAIRLLSNQGHQVELAVNGHEAVRKAATQEFDLILMDVQMPELNGFSATGKIRCCTRNSSTPILAMTAHAMAGDRERCLAAGMDGYIPKPISLKKLNRGISTVVRNRPIGPKLQPQS